MHRVVLVGGGLANSVLALKLAERSDVELTMFEQGPAVGGEHVWSFHDSDLTGSQLQWLKPLVECQWGGYEVRFPAYSRRLAGGYRSITSDRLHKHVTSRLGRSVRTGVAVRALQSDGVVLDDGSRVEADTVIDGRGERPSDALHVAAQKFVGQWIELEQPHGLQEPIVMDARVDQPDGYRFVYTLPFSPTLLHVEDTLYDARANLDSAGMREGIQRYATQQGWKIRQIVREEQGVLPIVLGGNLKAFWDEGPEGVARSGLRAALFHPTTGYSLPDTVRLAFDLSRRSELRGGELAAWIRRRSLKKWNRDGFYRLLNRMLFQAALPGKRHLVLQRFYRLPEPLIQRFYAGQSSLGDRARVLIGRPPVPLRRAWHCVFDPASRSAPAGSELER